MPELLIKLLCKKKTFLEIHKKNISIETPTYCTADKSLDYTIEKPLSSNVCTIKVSVIYLLVLDPLCR